MIPITIIKFLTISLILGVVLTSQYNPNIHTKIPANIPNKANIFIKKLDKALLKPLSPK